VLRAWLRRLGLPVPSAGTLAALLHDVQASAPDRVPCVNWPGARVYRYRGRLYGVADGADPMELREGPWSPGAEFDLGAFGRLALRPAIGAGLSRARLPLELRITSRVAGETFRPAGAEHHRPLRKWLQERGVLPWLRQSIPLVVAGEEIVAIGNLAYGDTFRARPDEPSWIVAWQDRPALTEDDVLEVKHDE
jgi:tRNA(Ile)-lysidine synthase